MLIFHHHHLIPNSDEQSLKWMMKMQLFCKAYYMSFDNRTCIQYIHQMQKSRFDSTKQYCCVFLHPNRIFVLQFQTINSPNLLACCLVHQLFDSSWFNHSSHFHATMIKWRATCDAKSFGEPRLLHALINAIAAIWHRGWPIISAM